MLADEAAYLWACCRAVRETSGGRGATAARQAVEELESLAMHAKHGRVRAIAADHLSAALSAPNAAARRAAKAAISNLRQWHARWSAGV